MSKNKPVIFLFNHDAGHQVAHSAGILGALAAAVSDRKVIAAYSSTPIRKEIEKLLTNAEISAIQWMDLTLPGWLQTALWPLNKFVPASRIMRLLWSQKKLRQSALIVSTERTCLLLKRRWGRDDDPRFCYIPHGSGDRNVAIHPALKDFDLFLLSGQKVVDQIAGAGITEPDKCRIIGYPKFDILRDRKPEKFFQNDNPVFLYNPHFDPHLSSWFDHGIAVLEYFRCHPEYNLIVAPHVMLFFKAVHISPEYKVTRRRPDIPDIYHSAPNIRIDTDSERLFDMSYTLAADAYIGDMSSQIYEFLYRPRPCFFIDVHSGAAGDEEPAYDFWRNGPVVKSAGELAELIPQFQSIGAAYHDMQVDRMAYTADTSDPRTASQRGASAIDAYLNDL
jgi:hypothetical protein